MGRRYLLETERLPQWARPFLGDAEIEVDGEGHAVLVIAGEEALRFPTLERLLATYRLTVGQLTERS